MIALLAVMSVMGAAGDCPGVSFGPAHANFTAKLAPGSKEATACMGEVALVLKGRSQLRSVTVAVRAPDADRVGGKALKWARAHADELVAGGLSKEHVSTLVLRADGKDAKAELTVTFLEAPPVVVGIVQVGSATITTSGAAVGKPVEPGALLHVGDEVASRGGGTSLTLGDGTQVTLRPGARVKLNAQPEAGSAKGRGISVELLGGELNASLTVPSESIEVKTANGGARASVASFRIRQNESGSYAEALEGQLSFANGIGVPAGTGIRQPGGAASKKLLASPQVNAAVKDKASWAALQGAAAFRVEWARDADFVVGLEDSVVKGTETTLTVGAGRWFWRVAAIDADGLIGLPSRVYVYEGAR